MTRFLLCATLIGIGALLVARWALLRRAQILAAPIHSCTYERPGPLSEPALTAWALESLAQIDVVGEAKLLPDERARPWQFFVRSGSAATASVVDERARVTHYVVIEWNDHEAVVRVFVPH